MFGIEPWNVSVLKSFISDTGCYKFAIEKGLIVDPERFDFGNDFNIEPETAARALDDMDRNK